MNDLTQCLYDFTWKNRMNALYGDPEYIELVGSIEQKTEALRRGMDDAQQKALQLLLEQTAARSCVAYEHLFRAALELARELRAAG